jgi:hypothetical protein
MTVNRVKVLEPIPKSLSTVIGCKAHGSALSVKKVLNVHEARLRAFFTSSLDHGLFARSRHKTGFGMSSMRIVAFGNISGMLNSRRFELTGHVDIDNEG